MKTQIMLDLETMGTEAGSVIASIGAVKFSLGPLAIGGQFFETFYQRVDLQSCVDVGLRFDAGTVLWWLKQDEAARKELTLPGVTLPEALHRFTEWVGVKEDVEVWGNGAAFDNVVLRAAFAKCGMHMPWRYWSDRCYRTVKALHPEFKEFPREGTKHNALDDAMHQARCLMAMIGDA